jgi:hypothetical protein
VPDPKNDEQQNESTEENTESTEENTEENTEGGNESSEENSEENTEENEESNEEGDEELDLDRAKAKIAKVNDEAKNLRNRLRESEDKLKNAKTPEEVEEIVKQMTSDRESAEAALLRENVALKHKLPESAIKRLTGNTREELEADAKELADLLGTVEDDEDLNLEGGLNPRNREDSDPDDPRALAKKYGRRGKRR